MLANWSLHGLNKSTGEWISGQTDEVVKNAGIGAYSQAVAAYEPAVAVQWAMTLPPGEARKNALQGVYPKKENGHVRVAPFYEALDGEQERTNPGLFSPAEQ